MGRPRSSAFTKPVDRPNAAWEQEAACLGTSNEDWWFPKDSASKKGKMAPEARKLCAECPVLQDCRLDIMSFEGLDMGFSGRWTNGNQAGMTPYERVQYAGQLKKMQRPGKERPA